MSSNKTELSDEQRAAAARVLAEAGLEDAAAVFAPEKKPEMTAAEAAEQVGVRAQSAAPAGMDPADYEAAASWADELRDMNARQWSSVPLVDDDQPRRLPR